MSWERMLAQRRVERREATREEIDEARDAVRRTLADARLAMRAGISPERCYDMAYDAARMAAVQAIRCAGYRIRVAQGAHHQTFRALLLAIGPDGELLADYFEGCRRKRNGLSYEFGVVTLSECEEILERARALVDLVESWIRREHGRFSP